MLAAARRFHKPRCVDFAEPQNHGERLMTTAAISTRFTRGALAATALLVLAPILACDAGRDEKPPAFLPSWTEARQALEWALSAWRDSREPPRQISSPKVQFVDQQRGPGDRLSTYQILAQTDIENGRQFTVRLTLANDETPRLVRYIAIGREPVWVFRLEDYDLISHWEHKMDEPEQPLPTTKIP